MPVGDPGCARNDRKKGKGNGSGKGKGKGSGKDEGNGSGKGSGKDNGEGDDGWDMISSLQTNLVRDCYVETAVCWRVWVGGLRRVGRLRGGGFGAGSGGDGCGGGDF